MAWAPSPIGIAQVEELRRTRVRICYRRKNGRFRHPIVRISQIAREPLLFAIHNPFNRAVTTKEKTFTLQENSHDRHSNQAV